MGASLRRVHLLHAGSALSLPSVSMALSRVKLEILVCNLHTDKAAPAQIPVKMATHSIVMMIMCAQISTVLCAVHLARVLIESLVYASAKLPIL